MSLSTVTVSSGRTTGEAKERGRSPAQIPFLFVSKLHSMLQDCDKDPDGKGTIVSWISEGKAFRVHKRKVFVETILPSYFNQTKYKSFQRQLNLWGFDRIVKCGSEKGAYFHVHFLRDQPLVIHKMRRIRAIKKVPAKERRRRQALFQGHSATSSREDNIIVSGESSISSSNPDNTNPLPSLEESWSSRVLDHGDNHMFWYQSHDRPNHAPSSATTSETSVVTTCSTIPSDSHQEDEEPDCHGSTVDSTTICGKELEAAIFMHRSEFCPLSNKGRFLDEQQDDVSLLSVASSLSLLDDFMPFFPISPEED